MQDEKKDGYGNCSCKAYPYVASITRTPILHSLGCWQDGISHVKSHLSRYHDPCWAPTIQTSFTELAPPWNLNLPEQHKAASYFFSSKRDDLVYSIAFR
jgi:hypothetical protein